MRKEILTKLISKLVSFDEFARHPSLSWVNASYYLLENEITSMDWHGRDKNNSSPPHPVDEQAQRQDDYNLKTSRAIHCIALSTGLRRELEQILKTLEIPYHLVINDKHRWEVVKEAAHRLIQEP